MKPKDLLKVGYMKIKKQNRRGAVMNGNVADTGKEILKTMTYREAKDLLSPLLEARIEKKKELKKLYKQIVRIVKKYKAPETFAFDFNINAAWLMHGVNQDIENQRQLNELERQYRWNETRRPQSRLSVISLRPDYTLLTQKAKQISIESLFKNQLRVAGHNKVKGLCPFHQEKTPSFTIFTESNTFFCFGCKQTGDSITFYQKLYGASFREAVRQLTGHL